MENLHNDLEKRRRIELDKIMLREIAKNRSNKECQETHINDFISKYDKYLCLLERKKEIDILHEEIERFKQDKQILLRDISNSNGIIHELTEKNNEYLGNIFKLKSDIKNWESKYETLILEHEKIEDEYNDELEKLNYNIKSQSSEIKELNQKIEHREIIIIQNEQCIKKDEDFIKKILDDNSLLVVQNKQLLENNQKLNEEIFLLKEK